MKKYVLVIENFILKKKKILYTHVIKSISIGRCKAPQLLFYILISQNDALPEWVLLKKNLAIVKSKNLAIVKSKVVYIQPYCSRLLDFLDKIFFLSLFLYRAFSLSLSPPTLTVWWRRMWWSMGIVVFDGKWVLLSS